MITLVIRARSVGSGAMSDVLHNFIDGAPSEAASTTPVLNPATGQEIAQAPDSTREDVDRAVAAARGAFEGWAAATPGERALALIRLADAIEAGKSVAQAASETLKRVLLELGGKAPVVVFDDVDMETALETIAGTGYYNAGQDCTAATRVLAGAKVYDDVVAGLAEQAKGYVMGDTRAAATTLGPLNSAEQRERVEGFIERKPGHAEVVT